MKMDRLKISITISALTIIVATLVVAAENMGGSTLKIDGGSKGEVAFPHGEHQEELKDCNLCHSVFPKELGVIKKMKSDKKIAKKQVMNDTCIKCHKDFKAAGKTSYGPVNCNGCHGK